MNIEEIDNRLTETMVKQGLKSAINGLLEELNETNILPLAMSLTNALNALIADYNTVTSNPVKLVNRGQNVLLETI